MASDARFRDRYRLTFGESAAAYDRLRPAYPAEAVDWVVPRDACDVVDVGAGTGKLTRLLAERGLRVTAVEPDPGMRGQLCDVLPDVPCLDGSGEHIPLPDHSVDLVVFAQSWHWVDPTAGAIEAARVLRPGGRLAMLWNSDGQPTDWARTAKRVEVARDEATSSAATAGGEGSTAGSEGPRAGAPFGALERRTVPWRERLPKEVYADRVLTHSAYLALSAGERAIERKWILDVLASHADVADGDDLELEQETECFRADLPPADPDDSAVV